MLLPSSFDTNYDAPSERRFLASPPNSPPTIHTSTLSSLFTTCRNLQSILSTTTHQLPPSPISSPPLLKAPAPKLRLKSSSRKSAGAKPAPRMRMRRTSKTPSPSGSGSGTDGSHKRRRSVNDVEVREGSAERNVQAEVDLERDANLSKGSKDSSNGDDDMVIDTPSTPKRSRIAPAAVPFGLTRSDFHTLSASSMPVRPASAKVAAKLKSATTPANARFLRQMVAASENRPVRKQSMEPITSVSMPFRFSTPATSSDAAASSSARTSDTGASSGSQQDVSAFTRSSPRSQPGVNPFVRASPGSQPVNPFVRSSPGSQPANPFVLSSPGINPFVNTPPGSQQGVSPLNNVDTAQVNDSEKPQNGWEDEESEEWTKEDDKILVEVVLEKLNLTRAEWEECAKSMGKKRTEVKKKWSSLMSAGEIGLRPKPTPKRSGIFDTWK